MCLGHSIRRRFARLPCHLASLALGLLVTAATPRVAAADLEDVLTAKLLRVGLPGTDAPPLIQTPANAAPSGLEGDFIAEVARRMGVKITFVRTARTPDELVAQVAKSEVDVAIGQLTDSLDWAKSVRFSRPYIQLQELRLVDRLAATSSGGAAQLLSRETSRVTSVAGSVVLPAVQEEFGSRLNVLHTLQAAVDTVLAGNAVAVIADDVAISRWLAANPAAGLRLEVLPRRDRLPGLAMAVNWKADDLQAWLNLCIEKCVLDGTLQSLASRHLGATRPRASR
jgi:ABC-type amino acid transport substrate-binding protein